MGEGKPSVPCCQKCGGAEYTVRLRVTGTIDEAHRFDGKDADNSSMWDSVMLRPMRTLRCRNCGAKVPLTKGPSNG